MAMRYGENKIFASRGPDRRLKRSNLLLQQSFDVSMNKYRNESLDARSSLEFVAFDGIDFMDNFERHVRFTRQHFNLGLFAGLLLIHLLAHTRSSRLTKHRCYPQIGFPDGWTAKVAF